MMRGWMSWCSKRPTQANTGLVWGTQIVSTMKIDLFARPRDPDQYFFLIALETLALDSPHQPGEESAG
uniref:Uncharacterized protein n=1 Tax=Acidobacterium capsulatum TaxID=33075 RepID=A0A7V5CSF4_9BACT